MSPYIVIEYRKLKYQTEADGDGHDEPIWNERIDNIPIYSYDDVLRINCIDLGVIYDEVICSTVLKIS